MQLFVVLIFAISISISVRAEEGDKSKKGFDSRTDMDCLNSSLKTASITPHFENGQVMGLLIKEIQSSSKWEKRGFQKGDIVVEIDGTPALDAGAMMSAATAVCKNQGKIIIKRKNKRKVL